MNYWRWFHSVANRRLLGLLDAQLSPDADKPLRHPAVFVLGAPRCGSTLIMQAITDALKVGYISNCHCHWYGSPALADRLFRPLDDKSQSDFRSEFGVTNACHAPAECGEWWYRFFRRNPPYVTVAEVDSDKMRDFRRSISAMADVFDRPVFFKNLYASLRLLPIIRYVPESLFLVIHRDEIDNGHSLLEARYNVNGDYDSWFSVEPPQLEQLLERPAHEQVIGQIRAVHETIDKGFEEAQLPADRRLDIHYEEFCDDPEAGIESVVAFLRARGCRVAKDRPLPEKFDRRREIRVDLDVYQAMREYVKGGK